MCERSRRNCDINAVRTSGIVLASQPLYCLRGYSLVLCAWCKQNCLFTSVVRTSGIVVHAEPKLNTTYLIYHVDSRMALVVMLVS